MKEAMEQEVALGAATKLAIKIAVDMIISYTMQH